MLNPQDDSNQVNAAFEARKLAPTLSYLLKKLLGPTCAIAHVYLDVFADQLTNNTYNDKCKSRRTLKLSFGGKGAKKFTNKSAIAPAS